MADSNVVVGFGSQPRSDKIGAEHYEQISAGARVLGLFRLNLTP
jgi:hypothetical protein